MLSDEDLANGTDATTRYTEPQHLHDAELAALHAVPPTRGGVDIIPTVCRDEWVRLIAQEYDFDRAWDNNQTFEFSGMFFRAYARTYAVELTVGDGKPRLAEQIASLNPASPGEVSPSGTRSS